MTRAPALSSSLTSTPLDLLQTGRCHSAIVTTALFPSCSPCARCAATESLPTCSRRPSIIATLSLPVYLTLPGITYRCVHFGSTITGSPSLSLSPSLSSFALFTSPVRVCLCHIPTSLPSRVFCNPPHASLHPQLTQRACASLRGRLTFVFSRRLGLPWAGSSDKPKTGFSALADQCRVVRGPPRFVCPVAAPHSASAAYPLGTTCSEPMLLRTYPRSALRCSASGETELFHRRRTHTS